MKKLVIELLLCIAFGTAFWWFASNEYCKCHSADEWKAIASPVKIYCGKWGKNGLEVVRK